ncbi:exodeoxyribonuclease VII small subunit [Psychrobacter phenylpyruvicus]|uniref:Uncharacterized protein n=1 Tax=Psychrobacter phenylpyruvicus TaxID=29432 RepID=A0A379LMB4_9GAMM|nr:exodeoxyribonuclease VII small subunit [Psychrobacter phenylpyruvicus]SUD90912.1 Uncharacterised protein [Psychrobacter phenylpyruvicus]
MATRTRKKTAPKTFKAAYQILKTNAEELQNSNEPDIDNLMDTVEQSIAAYKVCQARIEAVQQALDAAFDEDADSEDEEVAAQDTTNEQDSEAASSES